MSEKEKLTNIPMPHDNDVLSGRGGSANNHPGNRMFTSLVKLYKKDYVACAKAQKAMYSNLIYSEIRAMDPPGRFIKQDPNTRLWNDIGKKKALLKTRQALREGARELLDEINDDGCQHASSRSDGSIPLEDSIDDPEALKIHCSVPSTSNQSSLKKNAQLMTDVSLESSGSESLLSLPLISVWKYNHRKRDAYAPYEDKAMDTNRGEAGAGVPSSINVYRQDEAKNPIIPGQMLTRQENDDQVHQLCNIHTLLQNSQSMNFQSQLDTPNALLWPRNACNAPGVCSQASYKRTAALNADVSSCFKKSRINPSFYNNINEVITPGSQLSKVIATVGNDAASSNAMTSNPEASLNATTISVRHSKIEQHGAQESCAKNNTFLKHVECQQSYPVFQKGSTTNQNRLNTNNLHDIKHDVTGGRSFTHDNADRLLALPSQQMEVQQTGTQLVHNFTSLSSMNSPSYSVHTRRELSFREQRHQSLPFQLSSSQTGLQEVSRATEMILPTLDNGCDHTSQMKKANHE